MLLLFLRPVRIPQNKVNSHRNEDDDREDSRAELIIEPSLAPQPDGLRSPVEGDQRVDHGEDGREREEEGGDEGGPVTEVQHADGQRADDYA